MYKKNITTNKKHFISRSVLFICMIFILIGVVFIFSSNYSKLKLINIKYHLVTSSGILFEKLFSFNKDFYLDDKIDVSKYTNTLPVLLYHGIGEDNSDYTVTKKEFRDQMIMLKKAGFNTIDVDTFVLFMKGKIKLPKKSFLLTFDDGRKDSFYGADPILSELGFKALIFIAPGQSLTKSSFDSKYYLNIQEIKNMVKTNRWEIGSHAMQNFGGLIDINKKGEKGNFLSNRMWLYNSNRLETKDEYIKRLQYEFSESKKEISNITHKENILFSYPFGDDGYQSINEKSAIPTIRNMISKYYPYAFKQVLRPNNGFAANSPYDNSYLLKRIEIKKNTLKEKLLEDLENSTDLVLKEETFDSKKMFNLFTRWHTIWGKDPVYEKKEMVMRLSKEKPSSMIMLDGTRSWTNYQFNVLVNNAQKDDVMLYARLTDSRTYGVRCLWSNKFVTIEELSNVSNKEKNKFPRVNNLENNIDLNLGIAVKDNIAGCYENGNLVAAMELVETPKIGGIGMEFWTNKKENSFLNIKSYYFSLPKITKDDVIFLNKFVTKSLVQEKDPFYLKSMMKSFELPPRYATGESLINDDPQFFIEQKYGYIDSAFSTSLGVFTTSIKFISKDSGAIILWPTLPAKNGEDYIIESRFVSNVPSVLKIKFTRLNGSVFWQTLKSFPVSNEQKSYQVSFRVPETAHSFNVYHMIESPGEITIFSPRIYPLINGDLDKPIVSLVFDDGKKTFKENVLPILYKEKIPATVAIVTSHTAFPNYMNPKDLYDLSKLGFEISAHTRNHTDLKSGFSEEFLIKEIIGSWFDLYDLGFNVDTFVYPYGNYTEESKKISSSRFIGARGVERGFNDRNTDLYALKDQLVEKKITENEIKNWLSIAKKENSWLILEFHDVFTDDNFLDSEAITTTQLSMIIKNIKDSGLEVVTLHDGIMKLRER